MPKDSIIYSFLVHFQWNEIVINEGSELTAESWFYCCSLSTQKKIKPFCLLLADPVHSWHLGLLQQGTKQSLMEINLLEGVNESPNCLSMQDLLEHYALPEGPFSVRVAINISNKPKLPVKRGWRADSSPMICLIKAWFLLFLTFSKACVCVQEGRYQKSNQTKMRRHRNSS